MRRSAPLSGSFEPVPAPTIARCHPPHSPPQKSGSKHRTPTERSDTSTSEASSEPQATCEAITSASRPHYPHEAAGLFASIYFHLVFTRISDKESVKMNNPNTSSRCWPHAPPHFLTRNGTFMVTAGTYRKAHFFHQPEHLKFLHDRLHELAIDHGWTLDAWAVFPNHYHIIGKSPKEDARNLNTYLANLHKETASYINHQDGTSGRKVWHNFRETRLTYQKSYFARLHYVIQNPVKHGLVRKAELYPWCSANWFAENSSPAFRKTVESFRIDSVRVDDDF